MSAALSILFAAPAAACAPGPHLSAPKGAAGQHAQRLDVRLASASDIYAWLRQHRRH